MSTPKTSKDKVIQFVLDYVAKHQKLPTKPSIFYFAGITRNIIRENFGSVTSLLDYMQSNYSEELSGIFTDTHFSESVITGLRKKAKKYNKFIISTVVPNAPVNQAFLQSLKNYCKLNKALLLLLPTKGELLDIDPSLVDEDIAFGDIWLNDNIKIWALDVIAKTVNPVAPLMKYTHAEGSFIVPSPKQIFQLAPNMSHLPRAGMSPGAVTEPVYDKSSAGAKAHEDHFFGAIVVEIDNKKIFHSRDLEALDDGSFVDLGLHYKQSGKPRKLDKSEILRVDGDHHAYEIDPVIRKVQDKMQKEIPAWCNVSHDTWSQYIENHHEKGKYITNAQKASEQAIEIEKERKITKSFLMDRASQFDSVKCISSNHNDALARFNDEGRYLESASNWEIGHILSLAQFYGIHPVEFAINYYDQFKGSMIDIFQAVKSGKKTNINMSLKPASDKIDFLKEGQSFKFGGFELGFHGSGGAGGARGTPDAMSFIHSGNTAKSGGVVTGHTHTPKKHNRSLVVGTSTSLPSQENSPKYAKGQPNGWLNTLAFIYAPKGYKRGSGQLVSIINGKYRQ